MVSQRVRWLFISAESDPIIQWDVALVRLIAPYTQHILKTSISGFSTDTLTTGLYSDTPSLTFNFTGSSPLDRASLALTICLEPQGRQLKPVI